MVGNKMAVTQLIVNSIITGSIYALVASGFSLIYSTNRFIHFAHGSSVAAGAYMLYMFYSLFEIPFFLACILTLVTTTGIGIGMYKIIYAPLQKRKASSIILLIASIGMLIFFENMFLLVFGANMKTIQYATVSAGIEIFGARITMLQSMTFIVCIILLILLYWFMKKTRTGQHMRAVADNKELASIVGINEEKIALLSFTIGSFLAGLAGIFIGLEQNLQPIMGTKLMIPGLTAAIIGGIMFVPGAIVGSYVLGIITTISVWFFPSGFKDAFVFGILFIFLIFRPQGIFGKEKGVKNV